MIGSCRDLRGALVGGPKVLSGPTELVTIAISWVIDIPGVVGRTSSPK